VLAGYKIHGIAEAGTYQQRIKVRRVVGQHNIIGRQIFRCFICICLCFVWR
jgi:hypothetical protein